MPISLFNKSKRSIHGQDMGREFIFPPEKAMSFSDETATRLQRLYPGEVLSMEDVQKQFAANATGGATESLAATEKNDQVSPSAAPIDVPETGPLTDADKEQVRNELASLFIRLEHRGMNAEEIFSLVESAAVKISTAETGERDENPVPEEEFPEAKKGFLSGLFHQR